MTTATTRSVVIEKELPHALEKVWRALTQGALIKEWLLDNDFQLVAGHRFRFRAKPVPNWNGVIESEVLVVELNKKISYSWGTLELESLVIWTLAATGGGTLVRMEHSGFRLDQEAAYKGAKYGWQNFIKGLERVVSELQ